MVSRVYPFSDVTFEHSHLIRSDSTVRTGVPMPSGQGLQFPSVVQYSVGSSVPGVKESSASVPDFSVVVLGPGVIGTLIS